MLALNEYGEQCRETIRQCQSLEHAEDTKRVEMSGCLQERLFPCQAANELTEPAQCQPNHEDQDSTPRDLPDGRLGGFEIELPERHEGGDPHDKHEERKDEVGGCQSMP